MKEYKNFKEILLDSFDRILPLLILIAFFIAIVTYYSFNAFDWGLVFGLIIVSAPAFLLIRSFWKSYKAIKK